MSNVRELYLGDNDIQALPRSFARSLPRLEKASLDASTAETRRVVEELGRKLEARNRRREREEREERKKGKGERRVRVEER